MSLFSIILKDSSNQPIPLLPLEIHQNIRENIERIIANLAKIAIIDTEYYTALEKSAKEQLDLDLMRNYWSMCQGFNSFCAKFASDLESLSDYGTSASEPTSEAAALDLRRVSSSEVDSMGTPQLHLHKAKSQLQHMPWSGVHRSGSMHKMSTNSAFDVFSRYLSIYTPLGVSSKKPQRAADSRDLTTFTFEPVRPHRKLSRGDLFKEYKSRLDFKYPVDFNIIYCSSALSWDRILFGVKTRTKKQELVQMHLATKVCSKILSVGMIIDIITFGEYVVIAERNEPIKVFRGKLQLLSLDYRFEAQYCKNAYGNDSRIFHAYKSERLYYLTEANKIAEHSVLECFKGRLIDIPKSSLFECVCVVGENLYALSAIGELVQYSIKGNIVASTVRVGKPGYTYCTVVGNDNKLLVSGHISNASEQGAIVYIYCTDGLSMLQVLDFPGLRYPLHKFICFRYFNVRNWAILHKDATSTVFLYGESNQELRKITELKFSNVMLYDIHFHEDRMFCLGWEDEDIIQAVEFGIISLD
jgi:hypothetical protein